MNQNLKLCSGRQVENYGMNVSRYTIDVRDTYHIQDIEHKTANFVNIELYVIGNFCLWRNLHNLISYQHKVNISMQRLIQIPGQSFTISIKSSSLDVSMDFEYTSEYVFWMIK